MIEDPTFHVPVVEKRVRAEGNWRDVDFSDAALTGLDDI